MYFTGVLYIVVVVGSAICLGQHDNTCRVITADQYVKWGFDVEVICHSPCYPGRTHWTLDSIRIDDSLSESINSTYIVLLLKNFTYPSATLQCHTTSNGVILGGTTIKTYTKPSKIVCILEHTGKHFQYDLVCSWEHDTIYSIINYTVNFKSLSSTNPCSSNCISAKRSCTFKNICVTLMSKFYVTVQASTTDWRVDSDRYEFSPWQILKFRPPEIQVTALSEHLLVQWMQGPSGHTRTVYCQVKYNQNVLNITSPGVKKEIRVTIVGLESCANYTVAARCSLKEAPWSDWSQMKTVVSRVNNSRTKLDLWRKITEPFNNGTRKVSAMWKEILLPCEDVFRYAVEWTPYTNTSLTEEAYRAPPCSCSTMDINVDQEAYRITLTALYGGSILGNQSVYVPAISTRLPQINHIQTSSNQGDVIVSWETPGSNISSYMVDWTHDGNTYFWKQSKYTNTTLYDLEEFKQYNITVTPLYDDKAGFGTQAIPICSREGDPGNIVIDVFPKDRSALVTWHIEPQQQCSGVVMSYTILYSTTTGLQYSVTVDGIMQQAWLSQLKPDTKYSVYVMATALTGNTSSTVRFFETKRFDQGLIMVLGICGGVVIFLVLVLGISCVILWRKFTEKAVPNPGLSSLVLWSPRNPQKPFSNPSENQTIYEKVYPCELDTPVTSISSLATYLSNNLPDYPPLELNSDVLYSTCSDATKQKADGGPGLATIPASWSQGERSTACGETPSGEDPSVLHGSKSSALYPYQRQHGNGKPPAANTGEGKCLLSKNHSNKPALPTVYVTVDMFQEVQAK